MLEILGHPGRNGAGPQRGPLTVHLPGDRVLQNQRQLLGQRVVKPEDLDLVGGRGVGNVHRPDHGGHLHHVPRAGPHNQRVGAEVVRHLHPRPQTAVLVGLFVKPFLKGPLRLLGARIFERKYLKLGFRRHGTIQPPGQPDHHVHVVFLSD